MCPYDTWSIDSKHYINPANMKCCNTVVLCTELNYDKIKVMYLHGILLFSSD